MPGCTPSAVLPYSAGGVRGGAQAACKAARGARARPAPRGRGRRPARGSLRGRPCTRTWLAQQALNLLRARATPALSFFRASLCHQLRRRARRALMMRRGSALFASESAMVDARRANGGEHQTQRGAHRQQAARRLGSRERSSGDAGGARRGLSRLPRGGRLAGTRHS